MMSIRKNGLKSAALVEFTQNNKDKSHLQRWLKMVKNQKLLAITTRTMILLVYVGSKVI